MCVAGILYFSYNQLRVTTKCLTILAEVSPTYNNLFHINVFSVQEF